MRLPEWIERVERNVEDRVALEDIRKQAKGDGDLDEDDRAQLGYRIDTYVTDLENVPLDASA